MAARVVPVLGSLMQGVSAILFVFILAVGFNLAAGDLSESRWYVEKVSAVMIGGFGAYVAPRRAINDLRPRTLNIHSWPRCISIAIGAVAAITVSVRQRRATGKRVWV